MTAPALGSTTPSRDPGPPPGWVRRFADRALDMIEGPLRRVAAADADALLAPLMTDPAIAAPPLSPPAGFKIGERAEALLRQPDIPPDVAIRIRQDVRDLPEEAQVAWLEAWQEAKRFAERTPGMPEDYPLNTAWKAVNAVYQKTEAGWTRRTATLHRPEIVEQPGGKTVVMLPMPTGGGMEKKEVGSRAEADALIQEWQRQVESLPTKPLEEATGVVPDAPPPPEARPPQPVRAPAPTSIPESPAGRPLITPIEPGALGRVMDRLRSLAAKPEDERTDVETKEAHRLIDQVIASGYRLTADDWKLIRDKGFAVLEKSPQDLLRIAEPKPGKELMGHLHRGLAGGRLISILEDPTASRADKDQAEKALATLFKQDPSLRQLVAKEFQRRRTLKTAAHDESGQGPALEGESLSDEHWDRAVRGLVRNLRELLTSDKASEDEKTNARRSMGQLMTAASLGRTLETTVGERLIAAAEEVRIMPRTAQVEFDAKVGKYNVLHTSLLKPLTFASKDEAEGVARHMEGEGGVNPQVTKAGETFQVSHPDWDRPVAARTASDAQTIVEHKLRDLGDNAEEAKTMAQTIMQAANAEVPAGDKPAGDAPVATAPQAPAGDTKLTQEVTAAVQINADTKQTKQTGAGSGDNGAGLPKSTTPLVSGFPNTFVATPHGKFPNVPGTVSAPEGPAVPALAKGTTPDAQQLKTDNRTKFDAEVAKVNRAHGLVRATQDMLLAGSDAEAAVIERKLVEARTEIVTNRVTADMTPDAKSFFEKQMGELKGEDKPEDQKVAIAFAKTREQFPSTPEAK